MSTHETNEPVVCATCQACCCRLEVLVVAGDDVPSYYVDENEDGAEIVAKLDDGWCIALDRETLRCTIYERRPLVCREFVMGDSDCRAVRTGRQIAVRLR